jgi:hypothetical protein
MKDSKPKQGGPKKINPSRFNKGWLQVNPAWRPGQSDIDVRNRAESQVAEKLGYLQSDEYKRRLAMQGNKGILDLIKQRADALKNIEYFSIGPGSSKTSKWSSDRPVVEIASDADDSVLAHEIGHVTSGLVTPGVDKFVKNAFQSGKMFQSPAESLLFVEKNKNLSASQKKQVYNEYMENAKSNNYSTDPSGFTFGKTMDVHDIGAFEAKGDLDAVRYLLNKAGLTKRYGQDITEDILKKALQNKDIQNNKFFKRMRKNYSDKDIVELNNTIAKVDSGSSDQA